MPLPAGHASDAAQDVIGLLSFKHTLPSHVESSSTNTLKSFSTGLVLTHSLPTLGLSLCLPWPMYRTLQNFEVHTHLPLRLVKVPLDGIPSLQCTSELDVIGKLAESTLRDTVLVTNKDGKKKPVPKLIPKEHLSPLVSAWPLSANIQPNFYPLVGPSIKSLSLQKQGCHVGKCQMLSTSPGR